MKPLFITIALATALLVHGCQNTSAPPLSQLAPQDTLITMIERQIASKKLERAEIEAFRRSALPRDFEEKIEEYYPAIRKYSQRYGIDWRLIIAQILKESRFRENARSHVGAMGLMQIMPGTAREISGELDIAYIGNDPNENIVAGIYHMYKQLRMFPEADHDNRIKLALAAYNCGPARIFDSQDIARFKKLDANTWQAIRDCLPLLTPEYASLHLEVWPQGEPNYGYFYGSNETVDYVDAISSKYDVLKQMF